MREETAREEWDSYRGSHREVHAIVFDAAGNSVLAKTLLDLFDRMQRYSKSRLQWNAEYWARDEADHHAALAAIEREQVARSSRPLDG
jgi:DNA-binding GntR family transcriptional regulator